VSSATAWRMVSKALTRKSIEVTNRNQEEKLFHVQYDPSKQEEDKSLLEEVRFFLDGFQGTEQEYILMLVENNQQTEVVVTDKEHKLVRDGASLSLLSQLRDAIKADLAR
jgi:outer membrane protein assembly factor BamC